MLELAGAAVCTGLGLGVVSAQTILLELQSRCLDVLPAEGFPIVRQWYALHRTHKRLSDAARTFREMLLGLDPAVFTTGTAGGAWPRTAT